MENIKCPICDKNDERIIAQKVRPGIAQNVVICKTCGLVYLNPRLSDQEYEEYYTSEYHGNTTTKIEISRKRVSLQTKRGEFIHSFIKEKIDIDESSKVLEIGCNSGYILNTIKSRTGCDVYGLELGRLWHCHLKELGIKVYDTTLEDLHIDSKFDLIILSHIFEHFLSINETLSKLKRLLKDAGFIFIEVPNILDINPNYTLEQSFFRIAHTFYFSPASLLAIIHKNGLYIDRKEVSNQSVKILAHKVQREANSEQLSSMVKSNYANTSIYLRNYRYLIYPGAVLKRIIINKLIVVIEYIGLRKQIKSICKMWFPGDWVSKRK